MQTYRELTRAVAQRRQQMLEMIAELVGIESPTEDRTAINRCVALVEGWIKTGGGREQAQAADDRPVTC